ncbi:MAG: tetratricopeptide repeat protein [Bacteroidales bacterium]|nr:tetratricopeptide repeat protein [Bacteroidales bacterium]
MKQLLKLTFLTIATVLLLCGTVNAQLNKYYFFNRARILIGSEDYSQAIQSLNTLIKVDSTIAEAWFLRGVAKYNLNDIIGAQQDFSKSIKFNPVYSQAYLYRGITLSNLSKHQQALSDFEATIDLRPNSPDGYYSRGITYLLLNRIEKSIDDFNKVIQLQPKNIDAWLNRGSAKLYKGDSLSALADYSKATILNPFYSEAFGKRGRLYYQMKNFNLALDDLDKAISLDSLSSISYFFRALTHSEIDQDNLAMEDINTAIEISPDNALSIYNRAIIYWKIKEFKNALADFDRVIKLNPENVLVYYNKAVLQTNLEQYNSAIENFSTAIELFPDFANAYMGRASAHGRLGNYYQSKMDRNYAQSIAELYGDNHTNALTDTTSNFSNLIAFSSDFTPRTSIPFIDEYESKPVDILPFFKVIATDMAKQSIYSQGFMAIDTLNAGLMQKGIMLTLSTERGIKSIDSIVNTASWVSYLLKAMEYSEQKRFNLAIELYQETIDLKPNNPIAFNNMAVAQAEMVTFIASFEDRVGSLRLNMTTSTSTVSKNDIANQSDAFAEPIKLLEELIEMHPNNPYFLYNLGNLYTLSHQFENAILYYSLAIEHNANVAQAWYNRGLIRLMQRENELACSDLGKAGEMGIKQAYLLIHRFCKR